MQKSFIRKPRRIGIVLSLLILFIIQGGCFWKKKAPEEELGARELYLKGVELVEEKRYEEAREFFNKAKVSSGETETDLELLSQIAVADSYFEEKEYEAARAQYEEIFKLHSGGKIGDYIQYRIGECFFWQIDTIDRDTTYAKRALKTFNLLVENFPESEYLLQARPRIRETQTFLAESEFFIGRFYLRKNALFAAINRFKKAIALYPKSGIEDKLLFHLYKTYKLLKDEDHTEEYRMLLIERFPNSEYIPMVSSIDKEGFARDREVQTERIEEGNTKFSPSLPQETSASDGKGSSSPGLQQDSLMDIFRNDSEDIPIGLAGTYQGKDNNSWVQRHLLLRKKEPQSRCLEELCRPLQVEEKSDLMQRTFLDKVLPLNTKINN
jgi:outer membrane protein assembly factor BamD